MLYFPCIANHTLEPLQKRFYILYKAKHPTHLNMPLILFPSSSSFSIALPAMASIQAASMSSSLCKYGCPSSSSSSKKFHSSYFLPGFGFNRKELSTSRSLASGPRATLTFDPPATGSDTSEQRNKHTLDPSSPDFLPLPSFQQCFPKSTKEYR